MGALAAERPAVPPALQRFVVSSPSRALEGEWLNATEAARRLDVSRETVYAWIRTGRLLAWSLTRQGVVIPAEQIVGPGEVVPGLKPVLDVLPDPRSAWRFLTEESPFFSDGPTRPLDRLKADRHRGCRGRRARAHRDLHLSAGPPATDRRRRGPRRALVCR